MPLTFPSHPGLVAPLWRRWPGQFDALALCIGSVMPDVIDGIIGLAHGRLGQGVGHSLIGTVGLSVPLGIVVWVGMRAYLQRMSSPIGIRPAGLALGQQAVRICSSMLVGVVSHVVSDLVSHDGGPLFYPLPRWRPFPAWWSEAWFSMPVPGYPDGYPFAPHFVVWCVITVLGAWLLAAPALRERMSAR